jgi:hypothetical protein
VYSIVLMTALASGGQAANYFGYHGHYGGWGCWGCYGYSSCYGCSGWGSGYGCCGTVTPWLLPGPTIPAAEQKKWDDYVSLFEGDDRKDLDDIWARADVTARLELVKKIPPPPDKEEKDMPLSAEEKKKWVDYVKKLKGEKKQDAEDAWEKADLKGKRKLIKGIPDKE